MNRADFQQLAEVRIKEAEVLLNNSHYAGAYYLSGYAVECALKACIAKQVKQYDFPDKEIVNRSHTHKLTQLVEIADLQPALHSQTKHSKGFNSNWNIVKDWSEQARYNLRVSEKEARSIYSAITDSPNGVLLWLKKYW